MKYYERFNLTLKESNLNVIAEPSSSRNRVGIDDFPTLICYIDIPIRFVITRGPTVSPHSCRPLLEATPPESLL